MTEVLSVALVGGLLGWFFDQSMAAATSLFSNRAEVGRKLNPIFQPAARKSQNYRMIDVDENVPDLDAEALASEEEPLQPLCITHLMDAE